MSAPTEQERRAERAYRTLLAYRQRLGADDYGIPDGDTATLAAHLLADLIDELALHQGETLDDVVAFALVIAAGRVEVSNTK